MVDIARSTPAVRGAPAPRTIFDCLAELRRRVGSALEHRAAETSRATPSSGQGLFVTDQDVERALARDAEGTGAHGLRAPVDPEGEAAGDGLSRLVQAFGLSDLDVEILVTALAPDVAPGFATAYAYLNDDVTRRRPSVRLCLELCGRSVSSPADRARMMPGAPLVDHRLVDVESENRDTFLARTVRVDDRVVQHVLGDDTPDPRVRQVSVPALAWPFPETEILARAVAGGSWLCYVRSPAGAAGWSLAAGALASVGLPTLALDLSRRPPEADAGELAGLGARDAALAGAGLLIGPAEELTAAGTRGIDALERAVVPVLVVGRGTWDARWSAAVPVVVDARRPDAGARTDAWRAALDGVPRVTADLDAAGRSLRLTPDGTLRAALAARLHAAAHDADVDDEAVKTGARMQASSGLGTHARRIQPRATFDELVLVEAARTQVLQVVDRVRLREVVLDQWALGGIGVGRRSVTALFTGPSGTGKTLAAEVVAGALGLDLYAIDLSTVVDKYIGETEKNLSRVFEEAEDLNAVLFFDEADALFGKRSAVSDAHDRYANIEVAFLLQRMEHFDGVSILATNLVANIDEAFARRIDVRAVFTEPEEAERRRLWQLHLPPTLPRADDVDIEFLARSFRLTGGDIRNVAMTAAVAAAAAGREVGMADLVRATLAEHRKLGRLCPADDLGPYRSMADGEASGHTAPATVAPEPEGAVG